MMLWVLLGALSGPPAPRLEGLPICQAEDQPFSILAGRAKGFWESDVLVLGQVVRIGRSKTRGDGFTSSTRGTYRLRVLKRLKGGAGLLPLGEFYSVQTDDGDYYGGGPPEIGEIQLFFGDESGKGWLPTGEIRCLPIPPIDPR